MKTYVVVFITVFLAELGDKTQLATLFFATDPAVSKAGVFLSAAGALAVSSLLAVAAGGWLGHWVPVRHLKVIAGVSFIAIGLWMLARS